MYEKFIAELRLAGYDNQWITNHISVQEQQVSGLKAIRFIFNYFSKQIAERLDEFSIAKEITIIEYADVEYSNLQYLINLPSLRALHLRYYFFTPFPPEGNTRRRVDRRFILPLFPNLTTFTIEELYPEELTKIDYSQIPNVTHLSFTINSSLYTTLHHISLPDIPLESLQFLAIKYIGNIDLPDTILNRTHLQQIHIKTTSITPASQDLLKSLSDRGVDVFVESW